MFYGESECPNRSLSIELVGSTLVIKRLKAFLFSQGFLVLKTRLEVNSRLTKAAFGSM